MKISYFLVFALVCTLAFAAPQQPRKDDEEDQDKNVSGEKPELNPASNHQNQDSEPEEESKPVEKKESKPVEDEEEDSKPKPIESSKPAESSKPSSDSDDDSRWWFEQTKNTDW